MKMARKLFMVLTLLSMTVGAEEQNSSDLQVQVIRTTETQESVIYSGALSGYDGGIWEDFDFSEERALVIFDWDSEVGESLCIIPVSEMVEDDGHVTEGKTDMLNVREELKGEIGEKHYLSGEINSTQTNEKLQIETGFTKEEGNIISALSISNNMAETEEVQIVLAAYKEGRLLNFARVTNTLEGGEVWNTGLNIPFPEEKTDVSVKAMIWNPDDMSPYCEAIELIVGADDTGNRIRVGEPAEILPGQKYIFMPKSNGVYNFNGIVNPELYIKNGESFVQVNANSKLTYPNKYYLESETGGIVTVEKISGYTGEESFKVGEYFSDMAECGNLYRGQSRLYGHLSRWLAGTNEIYFNSEGLKKLNPETDEITEVIAGINPYHIVADENAVYYADWKNSGMIYRYETETGESILICKDRAAWLEIEGEFLYYKNLLDGGRLYRVEKRTTAAEQGVCAEISEEGE